MYRKFGINYIPIVNSVCRSELINLGQEFSIQDFREKRLALKHHFQQKLAKRLADDYGIDLFELYMEQISFQTEINNLNLKRVLNNIYNEKALHEKNISIILKHTEFLVNELRNQALLLSKSAELKSKYEVLKVETTNYNARLEMAHIDGLSKNVQDLGFSSEPVNATKKIMSFCWTSSLVNNKNVRFFQPDNLNKQESNLFLYNSIGIMH